MVGGFPLLQHAYYGQGCLRAYRCHPTGAISRFVFSEMSTARNVNAFVGSLDFVGCRYPVATTILAPERFPSEGFWSSVGTTLCSKGFSGV